MSKFIRGLLILSILFSGMLTLQSATSATASAASCNGRFLTFPTWYKGLPTGADCTIKSPTGEAELSSFIWTIVLNIIEMATQAVAYIAFFFVLLGGFQYLTSSGSPDKAAKARSTILNAIIGIVIALSATAVVNQLSEITANTSSVNAVIKSVLNIVFFAAGAAAIISIIVSGYKFTAGGSSPDAVAKARNGILYSVIGLIVIALSYAIVTYVLSIMT